MIKNNVYTVNPVMARALSNRSTQTPVNTPVSNMSVTEKAVLSSVQANLEPNQLAYSFVNVDGISLAADTSTSTLSVTYESPLNVSISGSSLLFKLIQNETQMFVSKAQVEEWTAKADGDHKHSGNDITTGTIPPEVLNNIPINKITGLENELNYLRNVTLNSYTKSEMDVKLLDIQTSLASTLEDMIGDLDNPIWKNPVGTLADLATAYPTPDPGWVATTIDTSIVYLYTGTQWLPISANSIPLATQTTAGLMSVDDKIRLDGLISGGGSDGAATTLGGFTQDYFLNRSSNAQEKTGDLTVANMYSKGAVVAGALNGTLPDDLPVATSSLFGVVKIDPTTLALNGSNQLTVIGGGGGSDVAWGTPTAQYTPLTVDAVTRNLSLDGHTHSQYLLSTAYTAADVLAKMLTVDGTGSGLDADLLDGQHGSFYFNRNTLFNANNVDYNAVNYEIGHGITTQPIHLPNYTGAVNAPFGSYGQMIHFDGSSFFPFRIAFDYTGRMFFQGAGYKPNGPYNYSSGTQWFEFFHSGNSNKKTVDWNAKDLKCVNTFADGAVVAGATNGIAPDDLPVATDSLYGVVKIDGVTIKIDTNGKIYAIATGGVSSWNDLTDKPANLTALAALTGAGIVRRNSDGSFTLDTSAYLTAITKTMVENVLTGTISTHNHSGTYQPADADLTAIAGLTDTSGLLKKTGANTWVLDTASYGLSSADITAASMNATTLTLTRSAGNITASIPTFNQSTTGNAGTATKLSSVRTFELTGDVKGSVTSDLASGVSISTTIQPNSVALGTDTTGNYLADIASSGNGISITGTAGEGATRTVTSNATSANTPSTIMFRDSSGTYNATNGIHTGAVVAGALNGTLPDDLPVATSSLYGVVKTGASINNNAGLVNINGQHYTTVTTYTDSAVREITAEISLGTGSMANGTLDQIQLSFAPLTTTRGLTANVIATNTGAGMGLKLSFRKDTGTGRWYIMIYNDSGAAVTRDGILLSIRGQQTI